MALLSDMVLRAVPEAARVGLANGDLALFGSVIRSAKTGQIVYHLQETGALRSLVTTALTPTLMPLEASKMASQVLGDAVLYRQGQQIKQTVNHVAHMQMANLFLSGATLGVSVAGFAYLSHRIERIDRQVGEIHQHLAAIKGSVDALRDDKVRDDLSMLRTMVQQMDESWNLKSPAGQLERVASECHVLANRFFDRSCMLLEDDRSQVTVAEPLLDAFGIAQSTRVAARLASDEMDATTRASNEALGQYEELLELTNPTEELLVRLRGQFEHGPEQLRGELDEAARRPQIVAQSVRNRAEAAEGVLHLVEILDALGIPGRELGKIARNEAEVPILVLDARSTAGK